MWWPLWSSLRERMRYAHPGTSEASEHPTSAECWLKAAHSCQKESSHQRVPQPSTQQRQSSQSSTDDRDIYGWSWRPRWQGWRKTWHQWHPFRWTSWNWNIGRPLSQKYKKPSSPKFSTPRKYPRNTKNALGVFFWSFRGILWGFQKFGPEGIFSALSVDIPGRATSGFCSSWGSSQVVISLPVCDFKSLRFWNGCNCDFQKNHPHRMPYYEEQRCFTPQKWFLELILVGFHFRSP